MFPTNLTQAWFEKSRYDGWRVSASPLASATLSIDQANRNWVAIAHYETRAITCFKMQSGSSVHQFSGFILQAVNGHLGVNSGRTSSVHVEEFGDHAVIFNFVLQNGLARTGWWSNPKTGGNLDTGIQVQYDHSDYLEHAGLWRDPHKWSNRKKLQSW